MKRWRNTLIVVGVFAALLAYVLLVERKREPPAEDGATPTPTPLSLLALAVSEIQAIEITDGMRTLHMEQHDDGWYIVGEQNAPTDNNVVFTAVNGLTQLSAGRILLENLGDGAQYGLDPARLTLDITLRSGLRRRLQIGKQTPDAMWYYLHIDGDTRLYLVRQYTLQPFFNWLDKPPWATPGPT